MKVFTDIRFWVAIGIICLAVFVWLGSGLISVGEPPAPLPITYRAFLLALMGWMPAPLDIAVWSSLWTLAKNRADHRQASVADCRFDFHVGYVVTGVLAIAFVSFGALVIAGLLAAGQPLSARTR